MTGMRWDAKAMEDDDDGWAHLRGVLGKGSYIDRRRPAFPGRASNGRIGIRRYSEPTDRSSFKGQENEEVGADGVHT